MHFQPLLSLWYLFYFAWPMFSLYICGGLFYDNTIFCFFPSLSNFPFLSHSLSLMIHLSAIVNFPLSFYLSFSLWIKVWIVSSKRPSLLLSFRLARHSFHKCTWMYKKNPRLLCIVDCMRQETCMSSGNWTFALLLMTKTISEYFHIHVFQPSRLRLYKYSQYYFALNGQADLSLGYKYAFTDTCVIACDDIAIKRNSVFVHCRTEWFFVFYIA